MAKDRIAMGGRRSAAAEHARGTRGLARLREQEAHALPPQGEREQEEHGTVLGWHAEGYGGARRTPEAFGRGRERYSARWISASATSPTMPRQERKSTRPNSRHLV